MTAAIKYATADLLNQLNELHFVAPVSHVYNPLQYARANCDEYISRFARGRKRVIFLGMNPGPFGMAQTGIPFGDIPTVRDYLKIDNPVGKPQNEHPKREVMGLNCPRVEVSGQRLWGAIKTRFPRPEDFFEQFYIANYCPLSFMEAGGRNRTPDKLPKDERQTLYSICDEHLQRVVAEMKPAWLIGVGKFAEARARAACSTIPGVQFAAILHPSPASPAANRGWEEAAMKQLVALGICNSDA